MLDHALTQWNLWARRGLRLPLSVNISPLAMNDSDLVDLIGDDHADDPLEQVESTVQHEQLASLMKLLNDQQQVILSLRYGLNGQVPHTLAEIGRQLGLTRERIRQIEQRAIAKLRQQARSTTFPIVVCGSHQEP